MCLLKKQGFDVRQTIWKTSIPFPRRYVFPAAERVGAELLDIEAHKTGNTLIFKKKFKTRGSRCWEPLRKQLGEGKIRKRRIIPPLTFYVLVRYRKFSFSSPNNFLNRNRGKPEEKNFMVYAPFKNFIVRFLIIFYPSSNNN